MSDKYLLQFAEIPESETKGCGINLPPVCKIGKVYPMSKTESNEDYPYFVDEVGKRIVSVFRKDNTIDTDCHVGNRKHIDYTKYFRVVEGVEALGYILSYWSEDEET
jgi:hypothetical protein